MTGLPGTDYDGILDTTTTATYIDVFTVTDSDDAVTCSIDTGDPAAAVFELRTGATADGMDFFIALFRSNVKKYSKNKRKGPIFKVVIATTFVLFQ